jgi:hypothetical protein
LKVQASGPRIQIFVSDMEHPIVDVNDERFAMGMIGVRNYCGDGDRSIASFLNLIATEDTSPASGAQ